MSVSFLHPHSSDGMEFACGHKCESTYLIVALRSVTSFLCILYAVFLFKRRSNDRPFVIIRCAMIVNLISRVLAAVTPSTLPFIIIFASFQNIGLYYAVFEWHKAVVDSSYKAVKVSLTSPRWNVYFNRIQQGLLFLVFPLTYALGADPSGNPLCDPAQAVNRAYRVFQVISVFCSLVFCNSVVHRAVKSLHAQNKKSGGNEGMQRRFKRALTKIRKILATITLVVTVNLISFALAFRSDGEPMITCFKTSSDLLGGLSGGIGGFLLLWVTDSAKPAVGSSTGTTTKSISESDEDGLGKKFKRIKTYTEMQAEKSRQSATSGGGFSSGASSGGGFASPPSPRANGGFSSPPSPSPRKNSEGLSPSPVPTPRSIVANSFAQPLPSPSHNGFVTPTQEV